MTDTFKLENKQAKEFSSYEGEIGLDSDKGIIYGIIEKEDNNNVYLNPHIAYDPLPLPNGTIINNIRKVNATKVISKSSLSRLVYEYSEGYLDKLVESVENQDNYFKNKYKQENLQSEEINSSAELTKIYNYL